MIRKLAVASTLAMSIGLAAPALAGPGQCYDSYSRPVGPVYNTDYPNYPFINAVLRRGGTCTGVTVAAPYRYRREYRSNAPYGYNQPYYDYRYERPTRYYR